jgi:nucleoside-diphosphate kinase
MLKPDAVERKLVGEIISRFEKAGFRIVAMKMVLPTKEQVKGFYPNSVEWFRSVGEKAKKSYAARGMEDERDPVQVGRQVKEFLCKYVSSGPIVAMVLEKENAVAEVRKLVGATDPAAAAKGTIRGDFGNDSIYQADLEKRSTRNLVHASGTKEEAEKEIKFWFKESELR